VNVCSLVGSPMNFCESCKFIPPIPISNTTAKELQCDTVKEDMGVRLRSFEVYGLCQMSSCFGFRWFPLVCLCGDARARTFGRARTHASPFPASARFVCPHEARLDVSHAQPHVRSVCPVGCAPAPAISGSYSTCVTFDLHLQYSDETLTTYI
jgi:hypothetical protein